VDSGSREENAIKQQHEGVMASIRKEIAIAAPADQVWSAVRDYGQVHVRLAPGYVTDVRLEEGMRIVTFASGLVLRELIVDVDDAARRLVWAAVEGRARHHNGAMQVFAEGEAACRLVWVTDILPHDLAALVEPIMTEGMAVMKATLERAGRAAA
jgi:Fe-S cluster assembly scaffold protein SufB